MSTGAFKSRLRRSRQLSTHFVHERKLQCTTRLPLFILSVLGRRLPVTTMTFDRTQVFSQVKHTCLSERRSVARERLPQCSVDALGGCRRLHSMHSSISPPSAVHLNHGLVLGGAFGIYVVRCMCTRTVLAPIKDLRDAFLPI
jgi:hypothetical protein